MEESEYAYFVARMNDELKAAEEALSEAARGAHQAMAAHYRQILVDHGYTFGSEGDGNGQRAA